MLFPKRQLDLLKKCAQKYAIATFFFGPRSGFNKRTSSEDLSSESQVSFWKNSPKTVKLVSLLIGVFTGALFIFSAMEIPHLNTSYSIKQFFPEHHPLFARGLEFQKTFYIQDTPSFLMVLDLPKNSPRNWLKSHGVATLKEISSQLSQNEQVQRVFSLVDVEGVFETEDTLTVGKIFDTLPEKSWKPYVEEQKLISKRLLSKDQKSTLVLVQPTAMGPQELRALSHSLKAQVQKILPESKISIGGIPAIQGRFAEKLMSELKIYLVLCFLIFCLAFSFLIGGKSPLMLLIVTLGAANLSALALLARFNVAFSVLLTTLPIILSIVIASLSVHCFHLWSERLEWIKKSKQELHPFTRWKASLSVLKELALPNFLGSLTTAVGFCSLALSDVPVIRDYGIAVSLAVMWGWALSHFILLGFMHLTNPRPRKQTQSWGLWAANLLRWSRPIVVVTAIATVVAGGLGKNINFSSRLFDDLPKNEVARQVTERIDKDFGGVIPFDLVLKSNEVGHFKSFESALKIKAGLKKLEGLHGVGSVASYTQLLDKKALSSKEQLAEALFLFTLSAENPAQQYVTDDGKQLRLAFQLLDLPSDQMFAVQAQAKSIFLELFPNAQAIPSGLAVRAHTINKEVSESLIFGFFESLALIFLVLIFIFRSPVWALISCVPNFIPPAVLLGAMAIFETPIKPTIALIFSIALGLAFNNTLYILGRLKGLCGRKTPSLTQIRQALMQEASPCSFESLLMFFGFMIFLTSSFQVNQTFGVYMLVSIVSGFVGDLIFLPSFLKSLFVKSSQDGNKISKPEDHGENLGNAALQKVASLLLIGIALSLTPAKSSAEVPKEVQALLNRVQKKVEATDDRARAKMIIKEPNGQTKEREMKIISLRDDQFYTRIHILSPADVKGTGFLAHVSKDEEKQWIYIPSTKKVRRVVGNNKGAGILGSELTVEDLDPTALRSSNVRIQSKDKVKTVLEVIPQKGSSPYSKVLTAISNKADLPLRTIYYKGSKKVKMVDFKDYKKVAKGIWRAQKIHVQNLENKRETDVILEDMKSNTGVDKDQFTQNALKFDSL